MNLQLTIYVFVLCLHRDQEVVAIIVVVEEICKRCQKLKLQVGVTSTLQCSEWLYKFTISHVVISSSVELEKEEKGFESDKSIKANKDFLENNLKDKVFERFDSSSKKEKPHKKVSFLPFKTSFNFFCNV